MSSVRNPRTGLIGAAAAVVLAALSLTACGNGTGVKDEGASASAFTSAPTSTATPAARTSTAGTASSSSGGSSSGASPAAAPPAGAKPAHHSIATKAPASAGPPVTCEGSNTRMVAALLQRPVNHMLLTVTNTGSRTCYLYDYPALRFSDAQAVPPVVAASHPQAVVTLDPGESGYASVSLSAGDGSGTNGRTVKSLTVYFYGRSGTGTRSVGTGAHPSLPAQGVHIDDSLRTTYWEQSMADALTW
ncbi:DUF4232 domain-containing protein [Streptantibioticus silvisoli]|uniref:DUF4232 domain-containing protein n=1 Tax=Streptantibioticus silvisoli TaxID=2705255 RepID=A0ABT6VXT2_9ACTN|nr:DUF4232 domain-containing protein [Streptantibioticus silvisoli]MDI5963293.1 DUF4232 domain-containing protein [Streptantibioticus silvisoli]